MKLPAFFKSRDNLGLEVTTESGDEVIVFLVTRRAEREAGKGRFQIGIKGAVRSIVEQQQVQEPAPKPDPRAPIWGRLGEES